MTPLQRLIEDVRDSERGLSYAKLAKRSERPDGSGGLSRGRLQQLATQPVRRGLDAETREALARALRMPVSVINDALSSSVGTFSDRGEDIETRRLLALVFELPGDQRDLWFKVARSVADALATHVTGTESDRLEKKPTGGSETGPSLPVDRAHIDVTPERHVVLARLGEALDLDPDSIADVVTFSQMLSERIRQKRYGS